MRCSDSSLIDCGPCPYLPGRWWHSQAIHVEEMEPEELERFLDQGYQRYGRSLYVPSCQNCAECIAIRHDVHRFRPSRSQRQVLKRNRDLELAIHAPRFSIQAYLMYLTFIRQRFSKPQIPSAEHFQFLLECHLGFSLQFSYRSGGELIGFGVVDPTPRAVYSYMFAWDQRVPERRLGTYSLLREIQFCRETGRDHVYTGLFVKDCRSMNYKAGFRPYELRDASGNWQEVP